MSEVENWRTGSTWRNLDPMVPSMPPKVTSILPQPAAFNIEEADLFDDLEDEADLDALVDALFPESLTKPSR